MSPEEVIEIVKTLGHNPTEAPKYIKEADYVFHCPTCDALVRQLPDESYTGSMLIFQCLGKK